MTVIDAEELRSLRNQKILAGRAVIHMFGYLRGDLAWKVGANARDQSRRNDSARLDDIARCWVRQPIGAYRFAIDGCREECELAVLHVQDRVRIKRWSFRSSSLPHRTLVRGWGGRRGRW